MNSKIDLSTSWKDFIFVGFDTETTGKYPLSAEICELAAVKWKNGQVIDTFQTLLKPREPMGPEVIAIHGITNDMVADAPRIETQIQAFHEFIQGAIPIAHHAPFDLAFLAIEFENAGLALPEMPAICSSLLSRKVFPESENHRLQTLIGFFNLERGAAHRALDDARACLQVGLRCMEKSHALNEIMELQGGPLHWSRFSMKRLEENPVIATLARSVREQTIIEMTYAAGSTPGEARRVHPLGIVPSLDGDFLVGYSEKDQRSKRYFLDKITHAQKV